MASREPFAIGGMWERHGEGEKYFESFSMLTINADSHSLMNRFHRPGDEKRMPVIIDASDYRAWVEATPEKALRFLAPYPAEFMTSRPEPLTPRGKREGPFAPKKVDGTVPRGELF